MNTLKSSEDPALYRRAKRYVEEGDKTFEPYLEWVRNGGKRTANPEDYPVHLELLELINTHYKNESAAKLSKEFSLYVAFFYRLRCKEFSRIPEDKCREVIEAIKSLRPRS